MGLKIINEDELAECLTQWFNETNLSKRNFWSRNPVAKTIKNKLNDFGHWRRIRNKNKRVSYVPPKDPNDW